MQVHGLRRRLPGRLLPRGAEHAGDRPRRVHRLHAVRARVPGRGDLRRGRRARRAERVHRAQPRARASVEADHRAQVAAARRRSMGEGERQEKISGKVNTDKTHCSKCCAVICASQNSVAAMRRKKFLEVSFAGMFSALKYFCKQDRVTFTFAAQEVTWNRESSPSLRCISRLLTATSALSRNCPE